MTKDELHRRLRYDPHTGEFTWLSGSRKIAPGTPAGWTDELGYVMIRVSGRLHPAHRLAVLYMTGEWPVGVVDHIDTNASNNRWENLRDVSKRTNQENRRHAGSNNKSGFLGVSPNGKRWAATINSRGEHRYLGTFDTPQLAHAAYVAAKREIHEGCTL